MNEAFRQKRGPTDVLSFPAQTAPKKRPGNRASRETPKRQPSSQPHAAPSERTYLGDIAISPSTARRNAAKYGRTLNAELRILMLHGVLHLMGYDHETDHGEMNRLEAKLRRRFGLA
jgi:probable rRNA maturation factor